MVLGTLVEAGQVAHLAQPGAVVAESLVDLLQGESAGVHRVHHEEGVDDHALEARLADPGQDFFGQVALAEVERREDLDAVAVALVEGLGDARPLPLEDGVVRGDEVVGLLVLGPRPLRQATREEGHDAAGEADGLAHEQIDGLAVVLDEVVVVLDLSVAAQQHRYPLAVLPWVLVVVGCVHR